MNNNIDLAIKNIIEANNNGNLAVFIGAGISKTSDSGTSKLPTWGNLIEDLKVDLKIEDELDFLKVAQMYYLEFGRYNYYKKLEQYFPKEIKPSEIHRLIFRINPHVVITTNWDGILEKTIEENAFVYDVVRSDLELTKSILQHKLIKMHGDFDCDNIVFKEDDYLKYQDNFPLLENYIKSILGTHTVLFLGYSYNDFNLKQILNWIQTHSKHRPPMYLVDIKNEKTREKYLKNHGITYLNIAEDKADPIYEKVYFDALKPFLLQIKGQITNINSDEQVLEFVYNKLNVFKSFDCILLEQIKKTLSECEFVYDADAKPVLRFFKDEITRGGNQVKRAVYHRFIEYLKNIDEGKVDIPDKLLQIFQILAKAGIKGIVFSKNKKQANRDEYLPFEEFLHDKQKDKLEKHLNFDYESISHASDDISVSMDYAFSLFQMDRMVDAYSTMENIIATAIKMKDYALLFSAMYNYNMLLWHLKFSSGVKREDRKKYHKIERYDLSEVFFNMTRDRRDSLSSIYEFVSETMLVQMAYRISEDLKKIEDSRKIIERGGMVFNSDVTKHEAKHKNLINFVLSNGVMIENLQSFQSINRHSIHIAIERQIQKEDVSLNRYELFACIKYIENKDLKALFDEFYNKDSKRKGSFRISEEHRHWIQNVVFVNLVENYLKSDITFNKYHNYIQNTIFILSLAKHSEEEFETIIRTIIKLIYKGSNSISIFTSINIFLGIQYNLFKIEIEKEQLTELIEILINKLIHKNYNGHEYHAITSNELSNLFWYADKSDIKFENKKIIELLLTVLDDFALSDKIDIAQNLLINLYLISNDEIKYIIKEFLISIPLNKEKEQYKRIIFNLLLVIYDLKDIEETVVEDIEQYIKKLKNERMFSSSLYEMKNEIDYLKNNRGVELFDTVSRDIDAMVDQNEKRKEISVF